MLFALNGVVIALSHSVVIRCAVPHYLSERAAAVGGLVAHGLMFVVYGAAPR